MRVHVLGPLEVFDGERRLDLGAGRHRALFVVLVLHAGEPVAADRLVDELWDGRPPASAAKLVQGLVSRLRRVLPPDAIATSGPGYALVPVETDAAELSAAVERTAGEAPADAARTLRGALSLWRGPPLDEFRAERWALPEIRRLEELRLVALEARLDADLALGAGDRLVPELEALAAEHPLREHLHAQLMLALYRAGRQADALDTYAAMRHRLVDELGIEPGTELRALQRGVLEHDPGLTPAPTPPEPASRQTRLPRRWVLAASVAGALAAAAALPVFVLSSRPSPAVRSAGGGAVTALGSSAAPVSLIASPGALAVGAGSVWATLPSVGSIARINPASRTVDQTIDAVGQPGAIAFGDGFVWVANSLAGTVSQIDPSAHGGKIVATIRVGNGPTDVAAGRTGIWVANSVDGTIQRIDVRRGSALPPIRVPGGADALAVDGGTVWAAGRSSGLLSRIDARSGKVAAALHVGNEPVAVAPGAGSVWVVNSRDGTVVRVDPDSERASVIPVGDGPTDIGVSPDGRKVWVANALAGTVSEIDPRSDTVVATKAVGALPQAVAVGRVGTYVALKGASDVHRGGTLVVAVPNPQDVYMPPIPRSLDPANGYTDWELLALTNDGLVAYNRTGVDGNRIVPDLALTLPLVSDDGRTYTFQLRHGIEYSDGRMVQPADIRRGIERAFASTGADPPTADLQTIVGADACSRAHCDLSRGIATAARTGTITFHLTRRDPDFLYKLALPMADAVPAGAHVPLPATGPYRVASYDIKRGVVRLERNRHFHVWSAAAQPDGFPDRIVERFGYTGPSAVRAVQTGRADITGDGPDQTWSPTLAQRLRTQASSRLYTYRTPATATVALWLNTHVAPFDDIRVRRALEFAVDRNHLIALAGGPDLAQTGCQILPPNIAGYARYCPYTINPSADGGYHGPDLAAARRLVAASHTRGERVTIWFYDIPIGLRNGAYLVSVLRSLGYRARLRAVPHHGSTWRPGRQAGVGGWAGDYPAADDYFSTAFTCASYRPQRPDANVNVSGYCNPELDRRIAQARSLQLIDPAASAALWSKIDRDVTDQALWVVIRKQLVPDFVSKRTGDYTYCYLSAAMGMTGACLDQLWVR